MRIPHPVYKAQIFSEATLEVTQTDFQGEHWLLESPDVNLEMFLLQNI